MDKNEAIHRYLWLWNPPHGFSAFIAALRDARHVTGRDKDTGAKIPDQRASQVQWIGAVAYLMLLDQIGTALQIADRACVGENPIVRALDCFSTVSRSQAYALYALRCALAHDYALVNVPKSHRPELTHHFHLLPVGPIVQLPDRGWNGDFAVMCAANATRINIIALGDEVEKVVAMVRQRHSANELDTAISIDVLCRTYVLESWPADT